MKILITGIPKSGKSTALTTLLEEYPLKYGFVTKEIVADGVRTGFALYDNNSRTAALADSSFESKYKVGRFYLNPDILDIFIADMPAYQPYDLLYIDEIGQMQLHSNSFKKLVNEFLAANNDFIGTITSIYDDDFVNTLRTREDVIYFKIQPDNRNEVLMSIQVALNSRELFNALPPERQRAVIRLANDYSRTSEYISLGKLFKNALPYISSGNITRIDNSSYIVSGNTNKLNVRIGQNDRYVCDCPLSQGLHPYDKPAECSHVQSVQIYRSGAKV